MKENRTEKDQTSKGSEVLILMKPLNPTQIRSLQLILSGLLELSVDRSEGLGETLNGLGLLHHVGPLEAANEISRAIVLGKVGSREEMERAFQELYVDGARKKNLYVTSVAGNETEAVYSVAGEDEEEAQTVALRLHGKLQGDDQVQYIRSKQVSSVEGIDGVYCIDGLLLEESHA